MNEAVAEVLPDACGVKVNVNGTVCPAAIVSGNLIPLIENSMLVRLAEDTATLEPLALSVPA